MSKSVTVKTREELMKALADEADEIRISHPRRTMFPFKPAALLLMVAGWFALLFGPGGITLIAAAGLALVVGLGLNLKTFLSMQRVWRYKTVERGRGYVVIKRR